MRSFMDRVVDWNTLGKDLGQSQRIAGNCSYGVGSEGAQKCSDLIAEYRLLYGRNENVK